MTVEEIDAAIAALESARRTRLLGQQTSEVAYSGRYSAKFSAASLEEIAKEITRLQILRARLTGERSGVGPVYGRFGPF